jgi:hypothetical protein
LRIDLFDGCVPTAEPGWTATPVTLSLAILFVARKAKKGDCGLLAADRVVGSAKMLNQGGGRRRAMPSSKPKEKPTRLKARFRTPSAASKTYSNQQLRRETASTRGNQPAKNVACQRRNDRRGPFLRPGRSAGGISECKPHFANKTCQAEPLAKAQRR